MNTNICHTTHKGEVRFVNLEQLKDYGVDPLVRIETVSDATGFAVQTIRGWISDKQKKFPKPLAVHGAACWRLSTVKNWLDEQEAIAIANGPRVGDPKVYTAPVGEGKRARGRPRLHPEGTTYGSRKAAARKQTKVA